MAVLVLVVEPVLPVSASDNPGTPLFCFAGFVVPLGGKEMQAKEESGCSALLAFFFLRFHSSICFFFLFVVVAAIDGQPGSHRGDRDRKLGDRDRVDGS